MRLARIVPATVLAALASFVVFVDAAPQDAPVIKVPQAVRQQSHLEGRARVIVRLKLARPVVAERQLANLDARLRQRQAIASTADQLLARLPAGAIRAARRYGTVPLVAMEASPAALDALERDAAVDAIWEDAIVRPTLADSVPLIEGNLAWSAGFDGTGTTIAIVDTGVDSAHPFLAGKVVEEACYSSTVDGVSQTLCPNGQDEQLGTGSAVPCPMPDCLHGTHVAGIAAGNDPTDNTRAPGVAKGAHVMAVQVFSRVIDPASCGGLAPCTGAFTSDIIAGLEHVYSVAQAGTQNIASVNLSLGGGTFQAPCDDQPYKPIFDNLRAAGIAPVVAAGNDGLPIALAAPACVSSAISVGATTKSDTVSFFSDVAPFLSLFAPGESITSSVPGGGYESLSGTSMAAPHVAGAWAIIRQAAPGASVDAVLSALRTSGLPITDSRYVFLGITTTVPRIRIFEALVALGAVENPVPTIDALSPSRIPAGLGALALTVTGGGFDGASVVQWNGAPRPTQFVSPSKLIATIPAADVGAAGTAQVRVMTPAPGGGTTASLTFTIGPPPVLTINQPVVAPGSAETVTLANGAGGAKDWIGLFATGAGDSSYLNWIYVGAGLTTRTWTVNAPTSAGTYEFRLYVNSVPVTTSPAFTVDPSANPVPAITALSPTTAVPGGPSFALTVIGSRFTASSVVRWNGANRPTTFVNAGQLQAQIGAADIAAASRAQITVFNPAPGGGTSNAVAFAVTPPPSISVSGTTVAAGAQVTATVSNAPGGATDWLALASTSAPNTSSVQWIYVGTGVTSRTWTVTMPSTSGTYEFRLFLNNGYTRAATSPPVSVGGSGGSPTIAVSATTVSAGASVTATLTNGAGGAQDWLALAAIGSPNTSYVQWTYVGAGVTTRPWTVAMPSAAGTYEFRLFTNNGFTRVATSPPVTVQAALPPSLSVSATNVARGSTVTVTVTNAPGGAQDWLALAATTAGNTSYLQWTYVGGGVTTRTWTVTMPSAAGTYEFRLFLNNGYIRAATSPPIAVF